MTLPELPNDIGAEAATLGSVLTHGPALAEVADWLQEPMFYDARHGVIYEAMRAIDARREPVDVRTVLSELRRREQLEIVGGAGYLAKLLNASPNPARVKTYGKEVLRAYRRRLGLDVSAQLAALCYDEPDDDRRDAAIQSLVAQYMTTDTRGGPAHIGEVMRRVRAYYESPDPPGTPTSLYDYDKMTGGLRPGHLVILAGRPGHGKSALASTIACNVAQDGKAVLFFTMEMDSVELGLRVLSLSTGIDGTALQDRALEAEDIELAWAAIPQIAGWPLWTEDVGVTLNDIRARVLRHITEHGPLAAVVVDYLQLVKPDDRYKGNRQLEVAAIARGLKELAQDAKTTVIALSQLNRDIERRSKSDLHPTLADLRESGEIEQAANQVTFVVCPAKFDLKTVEIDGQEMSTENLGLLYVEKQRGRKTGIVRLRFNAPCTRFENLVSFREMDGY